MFGIIIDWEKIGKCSTEDKEKLLIYIEQLLLIKKNFAQEGIYCFKDYLQKHADDFESIAIDLVCQGCMPNIVSEILSNLLQSTCLTETQYLKNILFTMFILMLQKGSFSTYNMKRILISYLGLEYSHYMLTENL